MHGSELHDSGEEFFMVSLIEQAMGKAEVENETEDIRKMARPEETPHQYVVECICKVFDEKYLQKIKSIDTHEIVLDIFDFKEVMENPVIKNSLVKLKIWLIEAFGYYPMPFKKHTRFKNVKKYYRGE